MDSNRKGALAEAKVVAEAVELGIGVLKPVAEHGRYDLAFDLGSIIVRVQCKWGVVSRGVVKARVGSCRHSPTRDYVRSSYSPAEVDAVAIYAAAIDECFCLPISVVAAQSTIHLRLDEPKNNQRGAIHWAADYRLGAVAQLAERSAGSRKVGGSNPPSSTPGIDLPAGAVGAEDFRNHLGWHLQRASAGETFRVTRRGRALALVGPPADKLELTRPTPVRIPLYSVAKP